MIQPAERIAYFDCFSGLAGDMTLGALIDLGLEPAALEAALRTLPVEGWSLSVEHSVKMGLRGVKVRFAVHGEEEGAAVVAPEWTFVSAGHEHHSHGPHTHEHHSHGPHTHEHPSHGPHTHENHAHEHHAHYRSGDILRILRGGALPEEVVERACAAFEVIAEAEAKVHGIPKDEVHFHEVGALDSILDIAGSAFGLWKLGVDAVESAPPPLGRGFIRCAHGRMPSPAPATLEILTGLPVVSTTLERELVTPTGAAFLKAWARRVGPFPDFVPERVGLGAGNADFPDRPNLLRVVVGHAAVGAAVGALGGTLGTSAGDVAYVVEANVDDLSPEIAAFVLERLFEAGAKDAWFSPLTMKKSRPGFLLGALAEPAELAAVEATLLSESSSIGLRRYPVVRQRLERRIERVETPYGTVAVKVALRGGVRLNVAPEYEDCARVARDRKVALKDVYQHAIAVFLGRAGEPPPKP